MKKLMIAAAAVVSTVAVNASTVSWSAVSIAESGSSKDRAGYTIYLVDNATFALSAITGASTDDALLSALKGAKDAAIQSAGVSWTETSGVWKGKTPNFAAADKPKDAYVSGDTPSYFALVLDDGSVDAADKYLVSALVQKTVSSTGALPMAMGSLSGYSWNAVPSGDVPEPTSAMLLVLGVAGLALRRRA